MLLERIKRIGDGQENDSRVPTKKKTDVDPCFFGTYLVVKWNFVFDKQLVCATAIYSMHVVGLQNQSKHPQIRRIQELKKCEAIVKYMTTIKAYYIGLCRMYT